MGTLSHVYTTKDDNSILSIYDCNSVRHWSRATQLYDIANENHTIPDPNPTI